VPEIVNQSVEQLAGEIQRSLDFYLATSGDRELSRICLSGGTANIQALVDTLQSRAQVPVEVLDPTRVADIDESALADMQGRMAEAVVSVGLALRKERERN
jgi:type IV pilus assembly protein PilM